MISFSKKIKENEIIFVTPPSGSEGWILEAIAREIANYLPKNVNFSICKFKKKLPKSKSYFFTHYMYYFNYQKRKLFKNHSKNYVWFTHIEYEKHQVKEKALINSLKKVTGIFCTNSSVKNYLIKKGCEPKKVHLVLGAADPNLFSYKKDATRDKVGFCSAFYDRKNPEKIYELVKLMTEYNFILVGKGWSNYENFQEMLSLPNFTYVEPLDYSEYPNLYSEMKVFVSTSDIEGGPIPLMEAMMSNVMPVVSDTGFASDIIINGKNGYIFPVNENIEIIANLVKKAFLNKNDVRQSVLNYSWKNFSRKIIKVILTDLNLFKHLKVDEV